MGPDVARDQLKHLLEVGAYPNVLVRMVPWAAGVHGGMGAGGGFSLLEFPTDPVAGDPIEPPLVYVDSSPVGALYLNKPKDVGLYKLTWADLERHALDGPATRQALTTALEGLPQ
jgi:hypothetical protein